MADNKPADKSAADKPPVVSDEAPKVDRPEYMALSEPAPAEDPPPQVIDEVAAETPSGHALKVVGESPEGADPTSPEERERGLRYRFEKYKKRWLS